MRTRLVIAAVVCMFVLSAFIAYKAVQAQMKPATAGANTNEQIEMLVRNFLSGVDTVAAHERFWADDLVYTGSSGTVRTKAEIVKSVSEAAAKPDPNQPKTSFDAEDIKIHDYGDFAVVNFRLVAHGEEKGKPQTQYYRNTGTLHRVNGEWKVIAWQATKIEEKKLDDKR